MDKRILGLSLQARPRRAAGLRDGRAGGSAAGEGSGAKDALDRRACVRDGGSVIPSASPGATSRRPGVKLDEVGRRWCPGSLAVPPGPAQAGDSTGRRDETSLSTAKIDGTELRVTGVCTDLGRHETLYADDERCAEALR